MMWIIRRKLSIIYSKILYYLLKNIILILILNLVQVDRRREKGERLLQGRGHLDGAGRADLLPLQRRGGGGGGGPVRG